MRAAASYVGQPTAPLRMDEYVSKQRDEIAGKMVGDKKLGISKNTVFIQIWVAFLVS